MIRYLAPATAAILSFSALNSAMAADMPAAAPYTKAPQLAPVYSWTGFYVGADIGARASEAKSNVTSAQDGTPPQNILTITGFTGSCGTINGCPNGASLGQTTLTGGVFGGYDWQINSSVVVGILGGFNWADKTSTYVGSPYPAALTFGAAPFIGFPLGASPFDSFAVTTKWDADIRGRLGYLVNPSTLIYGTVGVAWLNGRATSTCSTVPAPGVVSNCATGNYFTGTLGPSVISNSFTQVGWTVGGGIETRIFATNWTARVDYRYTDYGSANFSDSRTCSGTCPTTSNPLVVGYNVHLKTNTALFGVAYRFGNP